MEIGLHWEVLTPKNLVLEAVFAVVMLIYAVAVVRATKFVYDFMRSRGMKHNVAVYYNRKLIHVFAGGVVALLVPFLFTSPIIPFIIAMIMAIFTYIPHKKGELMYWFQVEDNMFEVNFCLMWGVSMLLAWFILGSPVYALIPILFMAFGDAATGIVRNTIFKKRTKSWWGNLAMFAVCAPIGVLLLNSLWGIPIAALASFVEHYEFNPIDDNVLISATSFIAVLLLKTFLPY